MSFSTIFVVARGRRGLRSLKCWTNQNRTRTRCQSARFSLRDPKIKRFVIAVTSAPGGVVARRRRSAMAVTQQPRQRKEMTMSTKAQANTELELGPLEAHELEIVSGGYNHGFPWFLG